LLKVNYGVRVESYFYSCKFKESGEGFGILFDTRKEAENWNETKKARVTYFVMIRLME